jgi:8-hydroxy-5-deazaflavin:NADPH oxidoreductase
MRIGSWVLGLMGGKLGTIFARAGHDVVFSYSHSQRKLKGLRSRGARGTPGLARRVRPL